MKTRTLLVALVAIGLPSVVSAQQERQLEQPGQPGTIQRDTDERAERPATPPTGERRESGFRGTDLDRQAQQGPQDANKELVHYLAARLMLANQCQIELSQMAAQEAENEQVKQFAQKVVQDHQQINQRLKQAVPEVTSIEDIESSDRQSGQQGQFGQQGQLGQPGAAERTAQRERQPGLQADARQPGAQQGQQAVDGAAKQLLKIDRKAMEHSKQMVSEMLQEKQGKEFDLCYLGQQVGAHTWMVAELKAIQEAGPQQLAEVAGQAQGDVEEHLEKAKELASNLMGEQSGQQTRQPGQPGQTERSTDRPFQQN